MPRMPFPRLSDRNLKLTACTTFAHNDLKIPHLKTPELQSSSKTFRFHIARVRFMMLVPAHLGDLSTRMQQIMDVAEFEINGKLANIDFPKNQDRIAARFRELFEADLDSRVSEREGPGWQESALASLQASTEPAEMLGSVPPLSLGLEAMFLFYLTGTWTAFETMCGDLWEAAVNGYPNRLAHLNGAPNRLNKKSQSLDRGPSRRPTDETKSIPLNLIQTHRFDLRNKMGTVLREQRFEFSRLEDIRRAYAQAFDKDSSRIEGALMDDAVDALRIVRNVIVHQGGLADADYLKVMNSLRLPSAELGKPILLDGAKVVEMISPVIDCASRLLSAVDDWIIKNEAANTSPGAPGRA